jgi:hypothetical protein
MAMMMVMGIEKASIASHDFEEVGKKKTTSKAKIGSPRGHDRRARLEVVRPLEVRQALAFHATRGR